MARKRKYRDPREYSVQDVTKGQGDNDCEDYHVSCLPWSSLDSRIECEKQGALDGTLVLRDYFSLSPAVQLSIKHQTYNISLEVFTNPGDGEFVLFTRPESINPSSAASIGRDLDQDNSNNDYLLSDEAKEYKRVILTANREYIIATQIHMQPQRLPAYTSTELAHFMYDEVKFTRRRRVKGLVGIDRDHAEAMAKFGFIPVKNVGSSSCGSGSSDTGGEEELPRLSGYFTRDGIISEAEREKCEAELVEKYGLKPYDDKPVGQPRVEKKSLNFEEYILAHGLDAPEVKRFFNDRLKLEGGFWEHELERLETLEKRMRGEEVTLKGWDKASSSRSSASTGESSGSGSSLYPPPLFTEQRPMSMHEYARKIAKQRQKPLEWGCATPVQSPTPAETCVPVTRQTNLDLPVPRFSTAMGLQQLSKNGLRVEARAEYIWKQAFGNFLGYGIRNPYKQAYPAAVTPVRSQATARVNQESPNESNLSGEEIFIYRNVKPSSNPIRQILKLPGGVQMDITDVNPLNPPSYNYTQMWLKKRADEDGALDDLEEDSKQCDEGSAIPDMEDVKKHIENATQNPEQDIKQRDRHRRTKLRPDESWIKPISDDDDDAYGELLHTMASQVARASKDQLKNLNNLINRNLAALQNVNEREGMTGDGEWGSADYGSGVYGYEDTYPGGVQRS